MGVDLRHKLSRSRSSRGQKHQERRIVQVESNAERSDPERGEHHGQEERKTSRSRGVHRVREEDYAFERESSQLNARGSVELERETSRSSGVRRVREEDFAFGREFHTRDNELERGASQSRRDYAHEVDQTYSGDYAHEVDQTGKLSEDNFAHENDGKEQFDLVKDI